MIISELVDDAVVLPKRKADSHKGDYGKILIVGGSVGFTGAPTLSAKAAVRSGAGLVYLGVPDSIYEITAVKNDEAMPFPLTSDSKGGISALSVETILAKANDCDVFAVGPGMGKGSGTFEVIKAALSEYNKPLVLDADAINVLPDILPILRNRTQPAIITPHEGEFLRIGGILSGQRAEDALRFSEKWNCILVLKGHRTIISFPSGEVFRVNRGNPGMATGGSGDVLTGVIAALIGQLPLQMAITTAVFLHSLAGDLCADRLGEYSMSASDIIEMLPEATKKITSI